MKHTTLPLYYGALGLLVAVQVLATLFQGSLFVHQSYQLTQLTDQQAALREELRSQQFGTTHLSLVELEDAARAAGFQPISKPATIRTAQTTVAALP